LSGIHWPNRLIAIYYDQLLLLSFTSRVKLTLSADGG
jgi:hypothetical protein